MDAVIIIGFVLLIVLTGEYVGGIVVKEVSRALLKRRTRGRLVLTYDDGPGRRLESRLVDLLSEQQVRATFFLNAKRSLAYPERVDSLKAAGQEVACHALEHLNAWRTCPWRVVADIRRAYAILDRWMTTPSLHRPPYGRVTMSTWLSLRRQNIRLAFWTHDSGDTFARLPDPARVVAGVSRSSGGVVLMHSFDRTGSDGEQREEYVIDVTNRLLKLARDRGLRVCCFSELFP
jgi:peptidoglycan/xylan/chitin deacetylase (PgdA/CDA1 family)